jgi:signal transduction histidine kinase
MTMAIALSGRKSRRDGWIAGLGRRALRVPLFAKLIGANVVIVAVAVAVHSVALRERNDAEVALMLAALAAASVVNYFLVRVAVRPVEHLEDVAERVLAGDFASRVGPSAFADVALANLGKTVNGLLDSLAAERQRIQDLGAEVVYAQDAERARVARELHDSIAQTLAAVRFQLAAASTEAEGDLRNRLAAANSLVGTAMEEVRNVSYALHPRVAEDLGLEAALGTLARQVSERSGIMVEVNADVDGPPIPANVSATLFRVAQEALRNIEVHSHAKTATVNVLSREGFIRIEITDDGRGFDTATVRTPAVRSALASVKDRVVLAGGILEVESVPNGGTRVMAELQTRGAA